LIFNDYDDNNNDNNNK